MALLTKFNQFMLLSIALTSFFTLYPMDTQYTQKKSILSSFTQSNHATPLIKYVKTWGPSVLLLSGLGYCIYNPEVAKKGLEYIKQNSFSLIIAGCSFFAINRFITKQHKEIANLRNELQQLKENHRSQETDFKKLQQKLETVQKTVDGLVQLNDLYEQASRLVDLNNFLQDAVVMLQHNDNDAASDNDEGKPADDPAWRKAYNFVCEIFSTRS